jgi:hypothetical protein
MTNTDPSLSLEQRVADLEALLAPLIEPRATVPPITIGEISDVPTVGSAIASQWAQEVTNRIVHRFANVAARDAWAAADGSMCITLDTYTHWLRRAGAWVTWNPKSVVGRAVGTNPATGVGSAAFDIPGSLLAGNFVAGRWYSLRALIVTQQAAAPGVNNLQITDAANTQVAIASMWAGATGVGLTLPVEMVTGLSGAVSHKLRVWTGAGSMDVKSFLFVITDMGPQ